MRDIVANRLDALENNIRGKFSEHTRLELETCDKSVNSSMGRLEYVFGGYRLDSPANIDSMLNKLKRQLGKIKDVIADCRDDERRETIANLEQTSIEIEAAIQGLEKFEIEGIRPNAQDDYRYEDNITQLIEDETDKFILENRITDERIIAELKNEMKGLKRYLVNTHDEHSVNMKRSMKSRVNEIGEELVARNEEKSQSQRQDKGIPGLEDLVADEKDANNYFLKSKNEIAFKEVEQPTQESKSNNESLFK